MKNDRKQGAGILGLGAAACVACCAGPILALLAGVAALGVVGTFILGAGALVLAATLIGAVVIVRQQRDERARGRRRARPTSHARRNHGRGSDVGPQALCRHAIVSGTAMERFAVTPARTVGAVTSG
jgi:hypothetical protein